MKNWLILQLRKIYLSEKQIFLTLSADIPTDKMPLVSFLSSALHLSAVRRNQST
jgi:hypothetical protein